MRELEIAAPKQVGQQRAAGKSVWRDDGLKGMAGNASRRQALLGNSQILILALTLSLPRVINFKFLLQPHQQYYITQYGERGFS